MALSSKGYVPSTPYSATNPVMPVARQTVDLSSTASTCRFPVLDGVNGVNLEMIAPGPN
jgi:hypothetical protein